MINIKEKESCCGCNACVQICPKKCIMMEKDNEGFLYPTVNINLCIDCHLCEYACPVLYESQERKPYKIYAAKNEDDEIRKESSSGGIFSSLAELIINEGGVVFGARFNEKWEVVHSYTESIEELKFFRGSKYVQSIIGNSYKEAQSFLKTGRKVLFSGTPCQILGLKLFLKKEYPNLLTVDFMCHGVPSPEIWEIYKNELINDICRNRNKQFDRNTNIKIEKILFREKSLGWKNFSFYISLILENNGRSEKIVFSESLNENLFIRGFLANIYLRPICYNCPIKSLRSKSDITIADFWGIDKLYPEKDDDKGMSILMINTNIGEKISKEINISAFEISYDVVKKYNSSVVKSCRRPKNRIISSQIKDDNKVSLQEIIYKSLLFSSIICKMKNMFFNSFLGKIYKCLKNNSL